MSESTTEQPTESEATEQQGDPADKPLGENGEKALKAERDARKAADAKASELQKQLDALNSEKMSDLERAQAAAKAAEEKAAMATSEALRLRVAAKHGISDEDADLFLTGTDVETLERQAARLVERTPTNPKPDPSQGAKGSGAKGTPADSFAEFFQSQI